ncbi:4'-phosphopantetheinyl transferase family protein [Fibrella aquatilis]|uniref:4'-phosphopantetheinyl transferase superfamily protein n=1 Tax=Fibrella aquatilis TaxID=2817059 RepID=A0A939G2W9_9BACT|nr:4'-phosphopantetheinyl transferase superfamily protein [Fibrella aquatilis]MBO0930095.1 4'-phosphopantetheinyl transferase superfamily protein [Fibrella aquatilis]
MSVLSGLPYALMPTVSCLLIPPVLWSVWQGSMPGQVPDNTISLFRCSLGHPLATPPPHWLTPTEWQRADRFYQPADRQRFVLGRALFRQVAGKLTGQPPEQVTLELGYRGKPVWVNNGGWHMNLAHADKWVLLALAQTPVGVDLETIQPAIDYKSLMASTFSNLEQQYVVEQADPRQAFYEGWTRKEALVKATGQGITDALPQLPVLTGTHTVPTALPNAAGNWNVAGFWVDTHHPAAVAWSGPLPTDHSPVTCFTV